MGLFDWCHTLLRPFRMQRYSQQRIVELEARVAFLERENEALRRAASTTGVDAAVVAQAAALAAEVGTTPRASAAELDGQLHAASGRGDAIEVAALLAAGADAMAGDESSDDGSSALMQAAEGGHTGVVLALLAAGADANATNRYGETALLLASEDGQIAIVQALLDAGADANAVGTGFINNGRTALMRASRSGHADTVAALLAAGADLDTKMNGGWTALIYAEKNGHSAIGATLRAAGAKDFQHL